MMMDIGRQAFAIDKPRPGAWAMLAVLIGLLILSFIDRQIISLMVDPIRADLGVDDFQISLLQGAAFGIFYVLCGLPIGWLVDRFSRRWVIWAGVTIWSLSTAASGLADSYWMLLIARIGVGEGEAGHTRTEERLGGKEGVGACRAGGAQ